MARDYRKLLGKGAICLPRWVVYAVAGVFLVSIGLKSFHPPTFIVQRLDSPNGEHSARLMRVQYAKDHFAVYVKSGALWRTKYYSPPITNDFRVDLEERLFWSADSNYLYFKMQDRAVWGYFVPESRTLSREELTESSNSVRRLH